MSFFVFGDDAPTPLELASFSSSSGVLVSGLLGFAVQDLGFDFASAEFNRASVLDGEAFLDEADGFDGCPFALLCFVFLLSGLLTAPPALAAKSGPAFKALSTASGIGIFLGLNERIA